MNWMLIVFFYLLQCTVYQNQTKITNEKDKGSYHKLNI